MSIFTRLLRRATPIDEETWRHATGSMSLLSDLRAEESARLKMLSEQLLAKKQIMVSDGPPVTPNEQVMLAAACCLPVLELGIKWYASWSTIVLFPDVYKRTWSEEDEFGIVSEYEEEVEGEVLEYGSVILSRRNVTDRHSTTVIHEMAHQLDGISGDIDGVPPLPRDIPPNRWVAVFDGRLEEVRRRADTGRRTVIDEYAGENREELFAVASERFFAAPTLLKRTMPDIYEMLSAFYRQDPAARRSAGAGGT
ncbi:MAG: zinc-dependent peptidase [bacterium]